MNRWQASQTVKPAITTPVWESFSETAFATAPVRLVIHLAFIGGGLLAGPGRHEVAVGRGWFRTSDLSRVKRALSH